MSQDLPTRLRSAFHDDKWVREEYRAIEVSIDADTIVLRGTVDRLASKRRAAALALEHAGHRTVVDRLRRRPVTRISDGELGRTVARRLDREPALRAYGLSLSTASEPDVYRQPPASGYCITVAADDGCVTLSGSVESLSHLRLAEVLIWWIDACELVENELDVVPPQVDGDGELTDAVLICIEKDPLVDASQLHIETTAGTVRIDGRLRSTSQHSRLVQDIWAVPGVAEVDDHTHASG